MVSSINFNINPVFNFDMSFTYSPGNEELDKKKLDDKIFTPVLAWRVDPPEPVQYDIDILVMHKSGDPKIDVSDSEKEKIGDLLYSLPSVTYDQFIKEIRRADLSPTARLFLVNSINIMLYGYAKKENQYASDSEIFAVVQEMITERIESGSVLEHPTADCRSIAPFTARLVQDLGFYADVSTIYGHVVTTIRTEDQGIMIIDRGLFVTGTSNFDLARSRYAAYIGRLNLLTEVFSPSGENLGKIPTIEGRLILGMAGCKNPVINAADSMRDPSLITEVKNNPTMTISVDASPSSVINNVGIDGWLWNRLNLNADFYVLGSNGGYNFGAIQDGLVGSFGTGIKFENERQAFRLNAGYTGGSLDAYYFFSKDQTIYIPDTKKNSIDLYRLSGIYLTSFPLGRLSFKAGNEFSGVVITTKVKGAEKDWDVFSEAVPQVSVSLPFQKGNAYVGSAMPIEFVQSDLRGDRNIFLNKPKFGVAFMSGGNLDSSLARIGIDGMYRSNRYSDNIDINMSLRQELSGLGNEIYYSQQWTNLEGYVPDDAHAGVGATVARWGFKMAAKVTYGIESWPKENRDYTSFLTTLSRSF